MEAIVLNAATRSLVGRKTAALRSEGVIPAVVYGAGVPEPLSIELNRNEFVRLYKTAGESTLLALTVDGKAINVLIQDLQVDPLRDEISHVDFRAVDMTKMVEAEVNLRFVGESMAMKSLGGTLVHPMETLRVRALPSKLISHIDVDISKLATFEDAILVKDLPLPEGMEAVDDLEQTVALVDAPRSDEEMAALNTAVEIDVTQVEKVEAKKKADEEAAAAEEAKK